MDKADKIILDSHNKAEVIRRSQEKEREQQQQLEHNLKQLSTQSQIKPGMRSRITNFVQKPIYKKTCKCCVVL